MDNGLSIFGGLAGIGALAAGIGFAYSQFRSGASKAKDDLIQTLRDTAIAEKVEKERLAAENTKITNLHQIQINSLNEKLGKLQGLYEASESSKKEYLAILQGRDPAQQKFMELLTNAAMANNKQILEGQKYMTETTKILVEIRTFMKNLNDRANETRDWHKKIDTATKKETGKPLRTT